MKYAVTAYDGMEAEIVQVQNGWLVETKHEGQPLWMNEHGLWVEAASVLWPSSQEAEAHAVKGPRVHWAPVARKRPGFAVHCFDGLDAIVSSDGANRWYICAQLQPRPDASKYTHYLCKNGLWKSSSLMDDRWETRQAAMEFAKAGPPGRLGGRGVPRLQGREVTELCPVCRKEYVYDTEQDAYEGVIEAEGFLGGAAARLSGTKQITLHLCPEDNGVIAVTINDEHGGTLYEPSTKEI